MPDRRRAGLLVLLVLLAGALPLLAPPFDLGALRLGGVSLLWWYVGTVAPVVAVLATVIALGSSPGASVEADGQAALHEAVPRDAVAHRAPDRACSAAADLPRAATASSPDS